MQGEFICCLFVCSLVEEETILKRMSEDRSYVVDRNMFEVFVEISRNMQHFLVEVGGAHQSRNSCCINFLFM